MTQKIHVSLHSLTRRLFQDNTGNYVVTQPPNIPIYLLVLGVIGRSVSSGAVEEFFSILASGAIFTWAFLELVYGESLFRRVLGAVVMTLHFVSGIMR